MLKNNLAASLLRAMGALLLRLRYRIEVRGLDAILAGTEFAKPGVAAAHPAMRQSRTP